MIMEMMMKMDGDDVWCVGDGPGRSGRGIMLIVFAYKRGKKQKNKTCYSIFSHSQKMLLWRYSLWNCASCQWIVKCWTWEVRKLYWSLLYLGGEFKLRSASSAHTWT